MSIISNWIDGPYGWTAIFGIVIFFTFTTILFYYTRDKYEPEPISRIIIAYIYGMLSVIPALIISFLGLDIFIANPIIGAIILAPVIEEFAKGIFVVQLSKDDTFDGPLDGLIYGAMVGSGFATIENLLYGFSATLINIDAGVQLTFYRSLPQIIGHPLYTGLMGAGIGAYKVGLHRNKYNLIWQSIVLHGMWNGAASIKNTTFFFIGLVLVVFISVIRLRDELIKAIELDKQAYERGYYEQKKQYIEYIKYQYNQWYNQTYSNSYQFRDPYQQNLYSPNSPDQHINHIQPRNASQSSIQSQRENLRNLPNEESVEKKNNEANN